MSEFQNQVTRTMEAFVAQIAELARLTAIETLGSAFSRRVAVNRGARAPEVMSSSARRGREHRGGRRVKRSPAVLEALAERFVSFVQANPGLRIEQINKHLGTTTKALALPIRKLVAEGVIDARGHKRSTTYIASRIRPSN